MHVDGDLPKKRSSKGRRKQLSVDSVPGQYINTDYLSTQSVYILNLRETTSISV